MSNRQDTEETLLETFYCEARQEQVSVVSCLDSFLWATTLVAQKNSICNKCPQGVQVRFAFAPPVAKNPTWLEDGLDEIENTTEENVNSTERAQWLWATRMTAIRVMLENFTKVVELTQEEISEALGDKTINEHFAGNTPVILGQALMKLTDADHRVRRVKGLGKQPSTFVWDPEAKKVSLPAVPEPLAPKTKPVMPKKTPVVISPPQIPNPQGSPKYQTMTEKPSDEETNPALTRMVRGIRAIALVDGFRARFTNEAMSLALLEEIRTTLKDLM